MILSNAAIFMTHLIYDRCPLSTCYSWHLTETAWTRWHHWRHLTTMGWRYYCVEGGEMLMDWRDRSPDSASSNSVVASQGALSVERMSEAKKARWKVGSGENSSFYYYAVTYKCVLWTEGVSEINYWNWMSLGRSWSELREITNICVIH